MPSLREFVPSLKLKHSQASGRGTIGNGVARRAVMFTTLFRLEDLRRPFGGGLRRLQEQLGLSQGGTGGTCRNASDLRDVASGAEPKLSSGQLVLYVAHGLHWRPGAQTAGQELLRRVEQGETIEVTDRGRPVALLSPPPEGSPLDPRSKDERLG
jgi:hypothetical protein